MAVPPKVAMALRVRRPDGTYDVGDAALVRLAVDEVVDPNTGQVIQAHIPSGVSTLGFKLFAMPSSNRTTTWPLRRWRGFSLSREER